MNDCSRSKIDQIWLDIAGKSPPTKIAQKRRREKSSSRRRQYKDLKRLVEKNHFFVQSNEILTRDPSRDSKGGVKTQFWSKRITFSSIITIDDRKSTLVAEDQLNHRQKRINFSCRRSKEITLQLRHEVVVLHLLSIFRSTSLKIADERYFDTRPVTGLQGRCQNSIFPQFNVDRQSAAWTRRPTAADHHHHGRG